MKTKIIEHHELYPLLGNVRIWIGLKSIIVVNQSIFYDRISETHKAIINYYE